MVTPNVRLVRPLGAGGMGAVWLADHLALHTHVVVKFISADLVKNPDALARFKREAAAASSVKSPHVVQMLDHGFTEQGVPFIVMEHLEGHDLGVHLEAHGRLEPAQVSAIVSQLARALVKAHERGIVHRDIKPQNVFLSDAGGGELFVKLLDFGIAKTNDGQKLDSGTKTGSMMGSPYYMSPEQVVGSKSIDHRSDLWSVGVVAYEALTGVRPFEAETVGGLAVQIHSAPLPVPSTANGLLPKAVDAWFARACSRDVEGRFQNARELADALSAAIAGRAPVALSIPAPSTSSPTVDAMANTAVDPAPSVRSSPDARSRTDAGLGINTSPTPTSSRTPLLVGIAAVALAAGIAIAIAVRPGSGGGTATAASDRTAAPTASATTPVPEPTGSTPSVVVPLVASVEASAKPTPTASHAVPTTTSHPTGKPGAGADAGKPVVPGGSDDDIK
jgi:serine/threonine-protein kinase